MNASRNKYANIKEVLFISKIYKPLIIAMLMLAAIVIITNNFTTLSKDINDIFLHPVYFFQRYI